MGNLIAPSKIVFKPNDRIYLEAFTKSGMQARTINTPLVTDKALECMGLLPFAYGIDSRYWDGAHVTVEELSIAYLKNRKFGLTNPETAAPTYKGDMLASSVEKIALKVSCGNTDGDSDNSTRRIGYRLTLNLEWDDFLGKHDFHPIDALWLGCIDYWDKQLIEEYQVVQLSLLEAADQLIQDKDSELDRRKKVADIVIMPTPDGDIDLAAYHYPVGSLLGARGKLSGNALVERQKKLIREGKAVLIEHDESDGSTFGFQP